MYATEHLCYMELNNQSLFRTVLNVNDKINSESPWQRRSNALPANMCMYRSQTIIDVVMSH